MALVNLQAPILLNVQSLYIGGTASNTMTAGHKIGMVFEAPETGTIESILWRTGTVVGTSTTEVRIETVSGGVPTGILAGTNSSAVVSVVSSTNYETLLTNGLSVTEGQILALVFAHASGTSQQIILTSSSAANVYGTQYARPVLSTGGAYALIAGRNPYGGLKYSTGYKNIGGFSFGLASTLGPFTSGEKGLRFRLPFKVRTSGFWAAYDPDVDATFRLREDGVAPGEAALASRVAPSSAFLVADSIISSFHWGTPVVLDANTWYRLTLTPSGSPGNRYTIVALPNVNTAPCCGVVGDASLTESSGSSWIQSSTNIIQFGLLVDQIDDGAGGGGGGLFLPTAMNGGYSA